MRARLGFNVCIRDDDAKTYEFRSVDDATEVANMVASTVKNGRKVRCHILAADPDAQKREEKYLASKGYRRAAVDL